jgi:hypothetical protein
MPESLSKFRRGAMGGGVCVNSGGMKCMLRAKADAVAIVHSAAI